MGHAHPTRQERSRSTAERLRLAARELLRARGYDELTVAEIAARAGLSVGGFYARFPSKEALALELVDRDLVAELEREVLAALDPARCAGLGVESLVRRYLTATAAVLRRNRALLRAVALASRSGERPALRLLVRELNERLHGRLRGLLLARAAEIRHPRPERAVAVAILAATAGLREVVLFEQAVSRLIDSESDAELVVELAAQAAAYLARPPAGDAPASRAPHPPPGDLDA